MDSRGELRSQSDPLQADFHLSLGPSQSELIYLLHTEQDPSLGDIRSSIDLRQRTRAELREETKGESPKPIPGTDATIYKHQAPNNLSLLIENGVQDSNPLDIVLYLKMVNLKIEGKPESEKTLQLLIQPGGSEFIVFEKVDKQAKASFNYSH